MKLVVVVGELAREPRARHPVDADVIAERQRKRHGEDAAARLALRALAVARLGAPRVPREHRPRRFGRHGAELQHGNVLLGAPALHLRLGLGRAEGAHVFTAPDPFLAVAAGNQRQPFLQREPLEAAAVLCNPLLVDDPEGRLVSHDVLVAGRRGLIETDDGLVQVDAAAKLCRLEAPRVADDGARGELGAVLPEGALAPHPLEDPALLRQHAHERFPFAASHRGCLDILHCGGRLLVVVGA
mmetsp:Transcript_396/g.832  ORF Transcript_396/g.832 Transcript_396/m.832 type:complete len:242 (+) Transcript_396:406-1131(+)